jgi:hypothetical protein
MITKTAEESLRNMTPHKKASHIEKDSTMGSLTKKSANV